MNITNKISENFGKENKPKGLTLSAFSQEQL